MTGRAFGKVIKGTVLKGCIAFGIFLGGCLGRENVLEAAASEAPAIVGLRVVAMKNGVGAECEFAGYENGSNYSMQLYLNQVKEDNSVNTVAGKEVASTGGGTGIANTGGSEVAPGIYKVTLVMQKDDGVNPPMVQFRNSELYDVAKDGENYMVSIHRDVSEKTENSGAPQEVHGCSHSSSLIYEVEKEANADQDALLAGKCSKCGEILSYSYMANSAYAAFLRDAIGAVQKAEAGEVIIDAGRWISFNQTVLDAVSLRPDVSVTVNYRYEGKEYTVTIPAGAEVKELADENGYCGFRYLDKIFAGSEIVS